MNRLMIDFETISPVDLLKHGAYVYVEHPETDALLASYKLDDGPVRRWKRGEPCPDDIREHILSGGHIHAHNVAFDRLIFWHIMTPKYGWPKPRLEQFRCTAVTAAAMSLPRSLDRLGDALGLDVKKDKRGRALMKIHSIPVKFTETGEPVWHEKVNDPESLEDYHRYCDFDVLTEEAAERRLIPLSDYEWRVYALNETINDRGLRIDVKSARAALRMSDTAKGRINAELKALTKGAVTAVTQVAAMTRWLAEQGVEVPSLEKETVEEFLFDYDDLPDNARRLLELRQEGGKVSVEKVAAMLDRVCRDGRARGAYLHHGAGQTGRFSSRGVQMHNMPKYRKIFEKQFAPPPDGAGASFEQLFETIRSGDPDIVEFMYGSELGRPLHLLSDATRSFIWAAPGHRLIDIDYSSIEGRMAAWFANEDWKLDAFRALDRGEGHGIYELAAAGIYGISVEAVTKQHRPTGKVAELSCQYQTGVGGIRKFARQAKLKLYTLYPALWESASEDQQEYADKRFEERTKAHDPNCEVLGREGWIAAELIKTGWRKRHPRIADSKTGAWRLLEDAATAAVAEPGMVASALGVQYLVRHDFLWCLLPSGRALAYGKPKMQETEAPWADKTLAPKDRERKMSLTVRGTDAQSEKWVRFPVYGGSLFNNVVQGSARDILVHGMFSAEAAGYPIVLHTHDEMAAELPYGVGSAEELARIANELPAWAKTLPLTADGWEGKRYRKS
jgi:DNA polymerase